MDMIGEVEAAEIRRDFPITRKTIYMNNGAVAPTPLSTIKAVTNFLLKVSEDGPDSEATHEYLESLLTEVRTRVAHLIKCDRDEVVLVASTTHGLNVVARGISWNKGDVVVVRGGNHEHFANYLPWLAAAASSGMELRELPVDENGFFDAADLEKAARGSRLITMSHVLYNTGALMPLEQVGKMASENGALFCVDAAQSAGALPIDIGKIGCHFMAFPGFKWLCGPLGIGVLYCSKKSADLVSPPVFGGESAVLSQGKVLASLEMPARLQGGFRNYPGAAGLEAALRYVLRLGIDNISAWNRRLAAVAREELAKIPGIHIYGSDDDARRSSIVSFAPPAGTDPSALVKKLEKREVILAARHVETGKKAVRIAPHYFNNEADVVTAIGYAKSLMQ
jgi:cysteine desulfurase/selenocysteine lyase